MTPIKSVSKTETKDFGQEPVNEFWLEIPAGTPSSYQDKNYMTQIKNLLDSGTKDGVICVLSEKLSSNPLCESLAMARDNGCRIYILANAYHSEMKNLEGCLIRYGGNKRLGSFILINPNSNDPAGCLFSGPFSDESINLPANLLLDLDNTQVSTLFRYFCYQFWNKAEKERIGNKERDTDAAPLDIYPPVGDYCDFQHLKTVWDKKTDNALITTSLLTANSFLKFSNFSNSTILSLFLGIDNNLVRSLKQNNNEIYAYNDSVFINTLKISDDVWLVPKTDTVREEEVYAIKLNSEQANVLDKHIFALSQEKAKYQYFANNKREKLSEQTIIYLDSSKEITINAQSTINLWEISFSELLSKENFENFKPDFADDGKSISIIYEWTNIPYTLPSGSKKHQLYEDWKKAEEVIDKYIDSILNDISENERKEGKFSKLKKFFFPKEKNYNSEYQGELESLKPTKAKYRFEEKAALEKYIKRINEICSLVNKDSSEIETKIEEANRKAEIEEKQEEIKKCESERDDKKRELQEKQKEIETKTALQEALQKEVDGLNSEKKVFSDEIASLQAKIKNTADNERKPLEIELAEKQKSLQDKENDIKIQSGRQNELKKQLENLKVAEDKITNERDKKNKEIKELNNNINFLNGQLTSSVKANQNDKFSVQEEAKSNMDQGFIDILKELVEKQGNAALTDAKKCKAFLADLTMKDYKKESDWILLAVEVGMAKVIDEAEDLAACKKAQIRDLEEKKGLNQAVAADIVNVLALVLRGGTTVTASPFAEKDALVVQELPHLPHVGELYKNDNETYLAITYWEEYDRGKEDAERLKAKLCAKEENNGRTSY
jgi:hypothetical protein